MATGTVSAKGWVVIPKAIREKLGLRKGSKVHFIDLGGQVTLIPAAEDPIEALSGILAGGPSLTEELIREHREELEREDREYEQWRNRQDEKHRQPDVRTR